MLFLARICIKGCRVHLCDFHEGKWPARYVTLREVLTFSTSILLARNPMHVVEGYLVEQIEPKTNRT